MEAPRALELDINPARLGYLLDLYQMKMEDLIKKISGKRDKLDLEKFNNLLERKKIPVNLLKRIDKMFEKGLNWYAMERPLPEAKSSSIFFRKDKFSIEPNFETRRITAKFEEKKFQLQNLCDFIDYKMERKIGNFSLDDNPKEVALELRGKFDELEAKMIERKTLKPTDSETGILKKYMALIEELDVFVFEHAESPKKAEKVNFNGFFMQPNIIVIRGQNRRKRELFTLIHEFAHYALNLEEIDEDDENRATHSLIERWCNDFVYYFLIGGNWQFIENLEPPAQKNSYQWDEIGKVSAKSSLSRAAIYTHLKIMGRISEADYAHVVRADFEAIGREQEEKRQKNAQERARQKELGKKQKFGVQKLQSGLYKEIVKINYFEGNIERWQVCDYLGIRSDKIERELY